MMTPPAREKIANLPNLLTLIRIFFFPVIVVIALFITGPELTVRNYALSATGCFVVVAASILDVLDGYLARKWEMVTQLGKLLDPVADKLVIMGTLVMLVHLDRVPAWVVVLILGREMAVTSLRSFASAEGVIIAASKTGKFKATLQTITAACLFFHYDFLTYNWHWIGMFFLWVTLVVTVVSGVEYFYRYFKER